MGKRGNGDRGQSEREAAPTAGFASNGQCAAECGGQSLGDRESEPEALDAAAAGVRRTVKRRKEMGEILRGDAAAHVFDGKAYVRAFAIEPDRDWRTRWAVLAGVV